MKKMIILFMILFSSLVMETGCQKNNPSAPAQVVSAVSVDDFEDNNLTNMISPPENQWLYDLSFGSSMQSFGVISQPPAQYGSYSLGVTVTVKATQYLGGNFIGSADVACGTVDNGGAGINVTIEKGYKRFKFSALCNYYHLYQNADMEYFIRIYDSSGAKYMEYSALNLTPAWQDFDLQLSDFAMLTSGTVQEICADLGKIEFILRIAGPNNARNYVRFFLDNVKFTP